MLVVDDDAAILRGLATMLGNAGYSVHEAPCAAVALDLMRRQHIEFAIIDLMLPDRQGWDLMKAMRRHTSIPIIVISAIADLDRRVQLLQSGADDYLVKPFEARELLARIEAVQRRLMPLPADGAPEFSFGPYRIDTAHKVCLRGAHHVPLTPSEFVILETLLSAPGRIYSRDQLLDRLHGWDGDSESTPRSIDVHIATLRAKIESNPKTPRWIETVWGMGYRFRSDDP